MCRQLIRLCCAGKIFSLPGTRVLKLVDINRAGSGSGYASVTWELVKYIDPENQNLQG